MRLKKRYFGASKGRGPRLNQSVRFSEKWSKRVVVLFYKVQSRRTFSSAIESQEEKRQERGREEYIRQRRVISDQKGCFVRKK